MFGRKVKKQNTDTPYRDLAKPKYRLREECEREMEKMRVGTISNLYEPYLEFLMDSKTPRELEVRTKILAGFELTDDIPKLDEKRNLSAAVRRMRRKMKKFGEYEIAQLKGDAEIVTKKEQVPDGSRVVRTNYQRYNHEWWKNQKPKWEYGTDERIETAYREIEVPDYIQIRITHGQNEIVVVPIDVTFDKIKKGTYVSGAIGIVMTILYEISK